MIRLLEAASRVRERLSPADLADELCCVFGRQVLREAYGAETIDAVPVSRWHIHDGAHPWSPVEAAWDAGIAEAVFLGGTPFRLPPVRRWVYCQGWSGLVGGVVVPGVSVGHTFKAIRLTDGARGGTVLRIDAAAVTTSKKAGRAAPGAEARWTTWEELTGHYTSGVAWALLRPVPTAA